MTDPTIQSTAPPEAAAAPEDAGTRVHLIVEQPDGPATVLEVPPGVSTLQAGGDAAPALGDPGAPGADFLIEPVRSPAAGGRPRLLMTSRPGTEVVWNDQLAPRATLLRPGDHLRMAGGPVIEVALYHVPRIGPAPEGTTATCAFCRTPVAGRRAYACPICDGFLHFDEDDSESALKCATIAPTCHGCNQPIGLTAGYLGDPELLNEPA